MLTMLCKGQPASMVPSKYLFQMVFLSLSHMMDNTASFSMTGGTKAAMNKQQDYLPSTFYGSMNLM